MQDEIDRRLLRQLQFAPDLPFAEIAERARVPIGTATRRLDRLRAEGTYKGQQAIIDWAALGYGVEVSLRFTLDKTDPRAFDDFLDAARKIPEVIEIQTFLGRVDVRLSVVARDMAHYQDVYRGQILILPHIAELEALMHVATIKSTERLPL